MGGVICGQFKENRQLVFAFTATGQIRQRPKGDEGHLICLCHMGNGR